MRRWPGIEISKERIKLCSKLRLRKVKGKNVDEREARNCLRDTWRMVDWGRANAEANVGTLLAYSMCEVAFQTRA